jgi:hypothetical protein
MSTDASSSAPAPREPQSPATCVTCGTPLVGHFCHGCGEKRADQRDLTLRAFAHYAAEALFNADAKLWVTVRRLVGRPGFLTREFVAGRRQPYVGPLQLFLIANLLFFVLLQLGVGMRTFTTDLVFHGSQPFYGSVAESMIADRIGPIQRRGGRGWEEWMASLSEEQQAYRVRFNEAAPRYANSMVILMAPMMALGFRLLRRRTLFVRELILSLHFMTFVLLLSKALVLGMSVFLLAVGMALRPVDWETAGPLLRGFVRALEGAMNSEIITSLIVLGALCVYLTFAFMTVHGDRLRAAAARALASVVIFFVVLSLYRGLLFLVVFWAVTPAEAAPTAG